MTAGCTTFSNRRSLQSPSDDTSPILSSIKTSHVPNRSKWLEPFASSPTLLLFPTHRNWKCALTMPWSMHISNFAAQFRLANEEFMQNWPIYDAWQDCPSTNRNQFFEVVRECQRAYVFIICGQWPWRRQQHNYVDITISALLLKPSCGKATPSNKPSFSMFLSNHPTSTSRNITESQSQPSRNHSPDLPTPITYLRSTPKRPRGYISLPEITRHHSSVQGNNNHAKT